MKFHLPLIALLCLPLLANAQTEKVLHETFELGELSTIRLNLYGEYQIEFWAGNNILAETQIQLYDGPPHVLDFFITEQRRYEITSATEGDALTLVSTDTKRPPIRYKGKDCFEQAKLRLFIPDSFEKAGEGLFLRKN